MTRYRYYGHFSGLGCTLWLLAMLSMTAVYAVLLAAWLAWAALVLPAAGIARVAGNRDLAGRIMHTLTWNLSALAVK